MRKQGRFKPTVRIRSVQAASLEGTVNDSSRAVIPQATIALRNTVTTQSLVVRTDDQGFFRADQLAVGTYEVRVEILALPLTTTLVSS
jgi:hypothetical protein